jgi:hypothetical protein
VTVYVDNWSQRATVANGSRAHTSTWCHLAADTTEELVAFAARIGLQRQWIQNAGTPREHFDVTASKRLAAVAAGAVEISWRDFAAFIAAKRDGKPFTLAGGAGRSAVTAKTTRETHRSGGGVLSVREPDEDEPVVLDGQEELDLP